MGEQIKSKFTDRNPVKHFAMQDILIYDLYQSAEVSAVRYLQLNFKFKLRNDNRNFLMFFLNMICANLMIFLNQYFVKLWQTFNHFNILET